MMRQSSTDLTDTRRWKMEEEKGKRKKHLTKVKKERKKHVTKVWTKSYKQKQGESCRGENTSKMKQEIIF